MLSDSFDNKWESELVPLLSKEPELFVRSFLYHSKITQREAYLYEVYRIHDNRESSKSPLEYR